MSDIRCGRYLTDAQVARGGKYAWGHKPKTGAGIAVGGGRAPRAAVVHVAGYDSTLAMVEENMAAVSRRRQEIEEEIGVLTDERGQMEAKLIAVVKELGRLGALRAALAPFCAPLQAAEAPEAEGVPA